MKKRLTTALAAGALVAAMLPGVAAADAGGLPNENSVVQVTPQTEGVVCIINGLAGIGINAITSNITYLVNENTSQQKCRFGPDDITAGAPPAEGVVRANPDANTTLQVNSAGHGWAIVIIDT